MSLLKRLVVAMLAFTAAISAGALPTVTFTLDPSMVSGLERQARPSVGIHDLNRSDGDPPLCLSTTSHSKI